MEGRCESCKWWGGERAHDYNAPYGRCRRNPPSRLHDKVLSLRVADRKSRLRVPRGEWLWVAFDDWCGAHSPKPIIPESVDGEGA